MKLRQLDGIVAITNEGNYKARNKVNTTEVEFEIFGLYDIDRGKKPV